nr:MAG: capsid protein [Longquan bat marnavirus 1]
MTYVNLKFANRRPFLKMSVPSNELLGRNSGPGTTSAATETLVDAEINTIDLEVNNVVVTQDLQPRRFQQQDDHESLDKFLSRRVIVGSGVLQTTDGTMTTKQLASPIATYISNAAIAAKVKNYYYISGDFEIVFALNATPGCLGLYALTGLPVMTGDIGSEGVPYGDDALIPVNCIQNDWSGLIDVATSQTLTITLPFVFPCDSCAVYAIGNLWQLWLTCLQPVSTAMPSGQTVTPYTIYGRFLPGYKLSVPVYQGQANAPQEAKPLSSGLRGISQAMGALTSFPMVSAVATSVQAGAMTAARIAEILGYSRDSQPTNPMPVMQRSTTSLVNVDGVDNSYTAALTCHNRINNDPRLMGGGAEDELSYASLFARKTIIDTVAVTSTLSTGQVFWSAPVTPFYWWCPSISDANNLHLSVPGYVGLPFEYWRGDLVYTLIAPMSAFQRCRLQVLWSPRPIPLGVPGVDPTPDTYSSIFDLTPGSRHEFRVGYQKHLPFMTQIFASATTTLSGQVQGFNGYLSLRIVNPIVSSSSTFDVTTMFIFMSAAPNMRFQKLSNMLALNAYDATTTKLVTFNQEYPVAFTYEGEGGAVGDGAAPLLHSSDLVPPSGDYPGDDICFGDNIASVRALMQKPSIFSPIAGTVNSPAIVWPAQFATSIPGYVGNSLAAHYAIMYHAVATSERWKLLPSAFMFFSASKSLAVDSVGVGALDPVSYVGDNLGAEVQTPYYQPYKFNYAAYNIPSGSGPGLATTVMLTLDSTGSSTTIPRHLLYHSFADDIRACFFRQLPTIVLNTTHVQPASRGVFGPF